MWCRDDSGSRVLILRAIVFCVRGVGEEACGHSRSGEPAQGLDVGDQGSSRGDHSSVRAQNGFHPIVYDQAKCGLQKGGFCAPSFGRLGTFSLPVSLGGELAPDPWLACPLSSGSVPDSRACLSSSDP